MINTFFGSDTLDSAAALLAALVIGFFFGFALERAGFSSSRRLAGIFYFRDMAVLKVMFTALITATLGLAYFTALGWIHLDDLFQMDTIFGAQIAGGLLLGVGFVLGGWCPGTAAAGCAAGKTDALIFLAGAVGGSILFNELFDVVQPLYSSGAVGIVHIYETLGLPKPLFILLFTVVAVGCFWGAEYVEKIRNKGGQYWNSPFLKAFSVALLVAAAGLLVLGVAEQPSLAGEAALPATDSETGLLAGIQEGIDHVDPEDLADSIVAADTSLILVDIRTPEEYAHFHIKTAVNVSLADLPTFLSSQDAATTVVLYSNGMTHPAQARDALVRMGYENVLFLTDGLKGFFERCLKPASLRGKPVPETLNARIRTWRAFFLNPGNRAAEQQPAATTGLEASDTTGLPGVVESSWLAENLGKQGLVVVDTRPQPEYNTGHIPGAFSLNPEHVRGNTGGLPSMLLPADMLARKFSLFGITPEDTLVLAYGDKVQDATLIAVALDRIGHTRYAVLNGGFPKWLSENRPVDTLLPSRPESGLAAGGTDTFSVAAAAVLSHQRSGDAVILDVRPADYYSGLKTEEARAGHIPGAINRPYTEDVTETDPFLALKTPAELASAYEALIPSKDATVILHCRTGHQASQTFFVLRRLLGYKIRASVRSVACVL